MSFLCPPLYCMYPQIVPGPGGVAIIPEKPGVINPNFTGHYEYGRTSAQGYPPSFGTTFQTALPVQVGQSPHELLEALNSDNFLQAMNAVRSMYDLNQPDHRGQTVLHISARRGLWDFVQYIIAMRPHGNGVLIDALDRENKTPLYYAITNGHTRIVNALLEAGANTQEVHDGKNLLHIAMMRPNNDNIIDRLLMNDPGLNTLDNNGQSAYGIAIRNGSNNIAQIITNRCPRTYNLRERDIGGDFSSGTITPDFSRKATGPSFANRSNNFALDNDDIFNFSMNDRRKQTTVNRPIVKPKNTINRPVNKPNDSKANKIIFLTGCGIITGCLLYKLLEKKEPRELRD